ncbi:MULTISPECIES: PDR/VanB family oxidoreductase [Pseudonocardia]|uniref:Phenoxybenzoate dioxygenase subunit beta n=2 Tax=Pseudonocardia TaxID=1847 RepID=A0A1Y2MMF6_PSEAH|nr:MULTISPECIES: PDR/VanB family oxidoreductase [Pseudonocardia]OSY35847.1 Phenoxybenzoate dioxygenase subunit beta [Pseudonocardia autotrophica]TDN73139.1 ferredoxin-NADP reductase [Pseudonocardia autotrophica]BBG03860.1 ferredoxin [Pseudonocardia autotrophica]GEC27341.1 ferredoxin [Pseudonocardia saturnea]
MTRHDQAGHGDVALAGNALDLEVSALRRLTPDVLELELVDPDGRDLPAWEAGAHVDVELGNGMIRQYSLCGDPAHRASYRIAVLREPNGRGGSEYLHDTVRTGSRVRAVGLRNTFELADPSARSVLVAGGIGVTPILSMVQALRARDTGWVLHYGGRSRENMTFAEELAGLGGDVHLYPQDEVGLLPLAEIVEQARTDDVSIYACGPAPMLDLLRSLTDHAGGVELHLERFTGASVITPTTGFTVHLTRSRLSMDVAPDSSLLDVLEEHGIDILSSCRSGVCGTCEVKVVSGTPDHRDDILNDAERAEGQVMMPCVSRATSNHLTLDL